MVSLRPSCISEPVSMIVSPPSWRMPTSKDTRVRVEGFSKIIASTLPANGFSIAPAFRRALRALASSIIARSSEAGTAERSIKCLIPLSLAMISRCLAGRICSCEPFDRRFDALQCFARFFRRRDQRRKQADDIVTGPDAQEMLIAKSLDETGIRHNAFDTDQQAAATDFRNNVGVTVNDGGEPLFHDQSGSLDIFKEAIGQNNIKNRIAHGHGQRI